ncbi:MAG: hypothetical protein GY702_06950 [Desulfobulbaceae bacterium]|nr:hypothetical protein [Desulfobulbaceae bacterium]
MLTKEVRGRTLSTAPFDTSFTIMEVVAGVKQLTHVRNQLTPEEVHMSMLISRRILHQIYFSQPESSVLQPMNINDIVNQCFARGFLYLDHKGKVWWGTPCKILMEQVMSGMIKNQISIADIQLQMAIAAAINDYQLVHPELVDNVRTRSKRNGYSLRVMQGPIGYLYIDEISAEGLIMCSYQLSNPDQWKVIMEDVCTDLCERDGSVDVCKMENHGFHVTSTMKVGWEIMKLMGIASNSVDLDDLLSKHGSRLWKLLPRDLSMETQNKMHNMMSLAVVAMESTELPRMIINNHNVTVGDGDIQELSQRTAQLRLSSASSTSSQANTPKSNR